MDDEEEEEETYDVYEVSDTEDVDEILAGDLEDRDTVKVTPGVTGREVKLEVEKDFDKDAGKYGTSGYFCSKVVTLSTYR